MIEEVRIATIKRAKTVTFLTGAGVSTASGIPDYRSIEGVYEGILDPEYLLSARCLLREPALFYEFVKRLYHPEAQPNDTHLVMKELEKTQTINIVSQNIDDLHRKAGSQRVINFHGSLYETYCLKCGQQVSTESYLKSDRHLICEGQLRPAIVLYGEGFSQEILNQAIQAVEEAEVLVIVGTSFQVHPFCDLIQYKQTNTPIFVINQTPLTLNHPFEQYLGNAEDFMRKLVEL